MTFPLLERKIIRGFEAHIKAGLGGATDYVAVYKLVYAPFGGKIVHFQEEKGGNWIQIVRENGERVELAHLSQYLVPDGHVCHEGEAIAVSGNTGTETTGPHLHIQCFDGHGERIDPETYFNAYSIPIIAINGTIELMTAVQQSILDYSAGMLTITWDLPHMDLPTMNQDQAGDFLADFIVYNPQYSPNRYIIIIDGIDNAVCKTFYEPRSNAVISLIPHNGEIARLMAFEVAHQFQYFYNANRPEITGRIEIIDSNFPSDDLIREKFRSVLPYRQILNIVKS